MMATMAKFTGKDLIVVLEKMEYDKLLDLALKNKSKKSGFSFQGMLDEMSEEEIVQLFRKLSPVVNEWVDTMIQSQNMNKSIGKTRKELTRSLNAVMDLGLAFFEVRRGQVICGDMLAIVAKLNCDLLLHPTTVETLKNRISLLCEKMFDQAKLYEKDVCCNILIFLLEKALQPHLMKRMVKRVFNLRQYIPDVLTLKVADTVRLMELLKKCAANHKFVNISEGQKLLRLILTDTTQHVREIHGAIKHALSTSTANQAINYGKIYCSAWIHALKCKPREIKQELELNCIQSFILLAVESHVSKQVENSRKLLSQFLLLKKVPQVAKMLYSLFQPILWRYVKSEDGVVRGNATQLLMDVLPLEDPDENIVVVDQELNDQMLLIKDLLTDDFQQVRIKAIDGLCLNIMTSWEIFSKDILQTYFRILVNDCSKDSSTHETRLAVVRGFKYVLENPLSYPLMAKVLPKCRHLFHDHHEGVRIAFVQLLVRVNTIKSIKFFDVVPVDELLDRLSYDRPLVKPLVQLLKNSYFKTGDGPHSWLPRCLHMVRENPESCNVFFHNIPQHIGEENTVNFIKVSVTALHNAVLSKMNSKKKRPSSAREEEILDDHTIVTNLVNGLAVMWLVTRPHLEKEENKPLLKMIVSKLTKCLGDLSLYYKDTKAWDAVYYFASLMPASSIPSLASLCFLRLKALPEDCQEEEEYLTLVECLCSQEAPSFVQLLNEWLQHGISNPKVNKRRSNKSPQESTLPRKRKYKKDSDYCDDSPKPKLALKLLDRAIEIRSSQKALLLTSQDQLKDTLKLIEPLRKRIELSVAKGIKDKDFLRSFHYILLRISALLESEGMFDSVKYMEELIDWYKEKLLQPQLALNSSWRDGNQTPSHDFKELTLGIFQDACVVMCDMAGLKLFNSKTMKQLKFVMSLLPLDGGMLLPVCRYLGYHVNVGMGMLLMEEENVLLMVPDCFSKIISHINNQGYYDTIPNEDMKMIQAMLSECLSAMHDVSSEMDELLECVIHCALKGMLSHIEATGIFQQLQKDLNFDNVSISSPTSTLLGIVFAKPHIGVCFLKQLQNHLSKPEMNIQTWVSYFAILKSLWDSKKSKIVERELHILRDQMEEYFTRLPLKMVDINVPQELKDGTKSFEELCLFEYSKLKVAMEPKTKE